MRAKGQAFCVFFGQKLQKALANYRLRLKRRRFVLRSLRKRRELVKVLDNTANIRPSDILVFTTLRNERDRLPFFLKHHRDHGVDHFLIVANNCTDGSVEYLEQQPDVSLWTTQHSYKKARFGVDWITWLLFKYGHNHWCLTLDADELFIYPHHKTRPLKALTDWLEYKNQFSFGTLMLDMYPKHELGVEKYKAGQNPIGVLAWFDAGNYNFQIQDLMQNLWIQGGPRAREFFKFDPRRAPTLNKIPLIKWNKRFAYVNSTHSALPKPLNCVFDDVAGEKISGILLHTKFLDSIVEKSLEEKERKEHFNNSALYNDYYDALGTHPRLWTKSSTRYRDWQQLEELGLMSSSDWV